MKRQDKHKGDTYSLDAYQVTLAIEGSRHAFELLYKRWNPKLLRFALRKTGNAEAANDVMQDAAMAIAKNISKLDDPNLFSSWAYTIVRRRAVDHIARAIKDRKIITEVTEHAILTTPKILDDEISLKQALDQLTQEDRLILTLFYVDGLKGTEMAAAMNIPLGTLKSRLFKARGKLKSIYETQPIGDET